MAQPARVKLTSISLPKLGQVCDEIMGIGKKAGVKVKGPIPLPVKRLNVVTRKSPCGSGTETYEKWEMKMHRRIIDINACLLYTSPSPRDATLSRMPSSA